MRIMFFEWNRISRVKGRVRASRACWRAGRHLTSRDDSMTMCLSKSQDYTSQTKILEGWTEDETIENQDVIFCSSFRNRRLGSIKFLSDFSIVNGQNLVLVPLNCIFLPRSSSGEHKDDDSEHAMMIVFFQNFNFFEWNRISRVKGRVRASRVKGLAGRHLMNLDDSRTMCLNSDSVCRNHLSIPNEDFGRCNKDEIRISNEALVRGVSTRFGIWTIEKSVENPDVIFCSSFQNLRLGA